MSNNCPINQCGQRLLFDHGNNRFNHERAGQVPVNSGGTEAPRPTSATWCNLDQKRDPARHIPRFDFPLQRMLSFKVLAAFVDHGT
jgi:hypothetical protein